MGNTARGNRPNKPQRSKTGNQGANKKSRRKKPQYSPEEFPDFDDVEVISQEDLAKSKNAMNLTELKKRPAADLVDLAQSMGLENLARSRKQDIIFSILKAHAKNGEDIFGPHHMAFVTDVPEEGAYQISIRAVLGPDQADVRIYQRDKPIGEAASLYAETRSVSDLIPLAVQEMRAGDNLVYLHLVGKDARSSALNLDLIEIVLEKRE